MAAICRKIHLDQFPSESRCLAGLEKVIVSLSYKNSQLIGNELAERAKFCHHDHKYLNYFLFYAFMEL